MKKKVSKASKSERRLKEIELSQMKSLGRMYAPETFETQKTQNAIELSVLHKSSSSSTAPTKHYLELPYNQIKKDLIFNLTFTIVAFGLVIAIHKYDLIRILFKF